ncbi:hypothetical protein [Dactylosporangium sp. CA-092794]|uniref:hypothetical protein n=1 Tax=Dactylosporangium sp. CA-092794 TaxID=3239929 RepID=UPI003D8BA61D
MIAVVSIVLPVVGLVLAAVSLVITVVAEASAGNFELGTLLVGLFSLIPGGKLLGLAARGAERLAPRLVGLARAGAKSFGELGSNNTVIKGILRAGDLGGGFGKRTATEFGKGVTEEVATSGLNNLTGANPQPLNAAQIFTGAAAGAVVGSGFDSFGKGRVDFDAGTGGPTGSSGILFEGRPPGDAPAGLAGDGGPPLPPRPTAPDGGPPLPPRPASDGTDGSTFAERVRQRAEAQAEETAKKLTEAAVNIGIAEAGSRGDVSDDDIVDEVTDAAPGAQPDAAGDELARLIGKRSRR